MGNMDSHNSLHYMFNKGKEAAKNNYQEDGFGGYKEDTRPSYPQKLDPENHIYYP